jgi:hypothetical protein
MFSLDCTKEEYPSVLQHLKDAGVPVWHKTITTSPNPDYPYLFWDGEIIHGRIMPIFEYHYRAEEFLKQFGIINMKKLVQWSSNWADEMDLEAWRSICTYQ